MFRAKLPLVDLMKYTDGRLEDEGVMHQLARHSGFSGGILPGEDRWLCQAGTSGLPMPQ
jgi:hypothetical protein